MRPRAFPRLLLSSIVFANAKAKRVAIRLVRWTGKSSEYVHPKHLLADDQQYWYLPYISPTATLLDVGCGNGMHTVRVARRCARAIGMDASLESLAVARRASRSMPSASYFAGDVEDGLPLASGRFDIVLCLDLLEHLHKRDLALREIRRVLRPAGVLLLAVPNRDTSWKRQLARAGLFAYSDRDHKTEYTLDELTGELARNGFEIVRLHPSVYDTPLIGLIDVIGGLALGPYRWLTNLRRRLAQRYPAENAGFFVVCRVR